MTVFLVEEWGESLGSPRENRCRALVTALSAESAFDTVTEWRNRREELYLPINGSDLAEVIPGYLWYWGEDETSFEVRKLDNVIMYPKALKITGTFTTNGPFTLADDQVADRINEQAAEAAEEVDTL
jgi:hypothetical protein